MQYNVHYKTIQYNVQYDARQYNIQYNNYNFQVVQRRIVRMLKLWSVDSMQVALNKSRTKSRPEDVGCSSRLTRKQPKSIIV